MKNFYSLANCALMCGALFFGGVISSCSDDDEGGGGGGQSTEPPSENTGLTTPDGTKLKLTSIGDYSFSYNAKGLPVTIVGEGGWETITISYNPMVVRYVYSSDDSDKATYTLYLNDKGYISKAVGVIEYTDSEGSETVNDECNFVYNADGRLTALAEKTSYSGTEDGERYSGHGSCSGTLTYNGNNLAKVVWHTAGVEDGEAYNDYDTFTYHYDNNIPNRLAQFSHSLEGMMETDETEMEPFFFLGLLGKPSAQFPTSVTYVTSYDDGESYESTTQAGYSFGSDGRLLQETFGYRTYNYSYVEADDEPDAVNPAAVAAKSFDSLRKSFDGRKKLHRHGRHARR